MSFGDYRELYSNNDSNNMENASVESKYLRVCDYFAILPSCSHSTMLAKCATTGLVCALLNYLYSNETVSVAFSS